MKKTIILLMTAIALSATAQPQFSAFLKHKPGKQSLSLRVSTEIVPALRVSIEPDDASPDSIVYKYAEGAYSRKSVFSYNENIITENVYYYSGDEWRRGAVQQYAFDNNGNQTLDITLSYSGDEIGSGYKYEAAFNANSTPLSEKGYDYDASTRSWLQNFEIVYTYDSEGRLTGGSAYEEYEDETTHYWITATTDLTTGTLEMIVSSDEIELVKYVRHYNPATFAVKAQELASEFYYYNEDEDSWVLDETYEYTYDAAGRLLTETSTGWGTGISWSGETQVAYTYQYTDNVEHLYDVNGNKLSQTNTSSTVYTYEDETISTSTYTYKIEYDYLGNRKTKSREYYRNEEEEPFDLILTGDYYYSEAGIKANVAPSIIGVYFNPVSENIHISGITRPTQVNVTNISGQTLLKQVISGNESIPAAHLPQGIYLVRANGKTAKFIKN
jgi:hypothetical protein